ncbi:alpha/beta fold hydrolase [Solimonas variicoloris]|uniref:alpha/beta fold hydrolase n=1 Tax=Solimonas variicoloris TaxID=254408 RepID=UPI0003601056|nr:alpha/beta hydrolase [Solimonas variicoloris]
MTADRIELRLADGRRLAYAEYGAPAGKPMLLMHGTPGGRLQARTLDQAAGDAGVRLIAADRPGMGHSDPVANLSYLRYATDVRQLLDHLGLPRITIAAISGGGGFALACAYALRERVSQLLLVSAAMPAPRQARKGTAWQAFVLGWLAVHRPRLAQTLMRLLFPRRLDAKTVDRMMRSMPAPDQRVMRIPAVQEAFLGEPTHDMLRQGFAALVHELALHEGPLGFELRELDVPVHLLHGLADVNVPVGVARYAAAQIPGATLELIDDAAHLFILESPERLFRLVQAPTAEARLG